MTIEDRRVAAEDRRRKRAARSDAEQIARLVTAGHGNCREAERLALRIETTAAITAARQATQQEAHTT